jgi:hypothetical protein
MDRLRAEGIGSHFRVWGVYIGLGDPVIYGIILMRVERFLWRYRKNVGRFVSLISVVIICMAVSICRGKSWQKRSRIGGVGVVVVTVPLKHLKVLSSGCCIVHSVVIILSCIHWVMLIVGVGVRQTSVDLRQGPRKCIVSLAARRMIAGVRLRRPIVARPASVEALRVRGGRSGVGWQWPSLHRSILPWAGNMGLIFHHRSYALSPRSRFLNLGSRVVVCQLDPDFSRVFFPALQLLPFVALAATRNYDLCQVDKGISDEIGFLVVVENRELEAVVIGSVEDLEPQLLIPGRC